ncbi:hypothetical protein HDU93_000478 [Gonapodya sp. JEL0774]|nr:hypothetical protein HDU93_000478 [Gonapodya sp. JEL0774]
MNLTSLRTHAASGSLFPGACAVLEAVPTTMFDNVTHSLVLNGAGVMKEALWKSVSVIDWGNQFTAGGVTLAILGAVFAFFMRFVDYCIESVKRDWIVTAEFDDRDNTFSWILGFLADHPSSRTTTRFSVVSDIAGRRSELHMGGDDLTIFKDPDDLQPVYYLPNPGAHVIWFKSHLLYLTRVRNQPNESGASVAPTEVITISAFGSRAIIEQLVNEAQKKWLEAEKGRTVVHSSDQYGDWRRTRSRPIRPLSTIVLDRGLKNRILSDVIEFLHSEKWYADRGIPYRRGYLLYGPPGTGKTSFIAALAGHLRFNIYVISLSNKNLTDQMLLDLMCETPAHAVLLLEDVDAAFKSRDAQQLDGDEDKEKSGKAGNNDSTPRGITFSGLLNAIDGVAAQEGRILCMTTNHIEQLDPALIRPGRIDVRVRFDKASRVQAKNLYKNFFGVEDAPAAQRMKLALEGVKVADDDDQETTKKESKEAEVLSKAELDELAENFSSRIPEKAFSAAEIQVYLMSYKYQPRLALEKVNILLDALKG